MSWLKSLSTHEADITKQPAGFDNRHWSCAGFTLLSALVSAAFSILALQRSGGHEYALYAASRSVALLTAIVYAMLRRLSPGLTILAAVMILVQMFDGLIGFRLHEPDKAYGPIAFAAINLALLLRMHRANGARSSQVPR